MNDPLQRFYDINSTFSKPPPNYHSPEIYPDIGCTQRGTDRFAVMYASQNDVTFVFGGNKDSTSKFLKFLITGGSWSKCQKVHSIL